MWVICFALSIAAVLMAVLIPVSAFVFAKKRLSVFKTLFAGVFIATFFIFFPIHRISSDDGFLGACHSVLLSVFNSMQIFTIEAGFELVSESLASCPDWLTDGYQAWAATIFVMAPVFTFGFVLSLFKNISAYFKYIFSYFKDAYIFTELNDKSIVLAQDIKKHHKNSIIVFNDVFEDSDERMYELTAKAKKLGAVCFKKDVLVVDYRKHSPNKSISFFAIGDDETENMNHAIKLTQMYNKRDDTHIYVFSTKVGSELLLTAVDKGKVKVRRINEVQSLINRVLFENGSLLFDTAIEGEDGVKDISALVVGMGCHGTEMVKALTWYGQMNGYRIEINAFDKDALAEDRFTAIAPELMSEKYNGVMIEGESQYKITIHSGYDVDTKTFFDKVEGLSKITYVLVSLGSDDANIKAAVNLRMIFERMKIHPVIHAIVYNSEQKNALGGIKNYRGQPYDIDFIGDIESSYTQDVIVNSDLEADALKRHLKWGKEEEFWTYEYNYRSSMASAIHMKARIGCGIPGSDKKEEDLTEEERDIIEVLEHRRWNAYMRSEGYIFSGSKEKSSRNDLAKMHHDLVDFSSLSEEDKRKDSSVGTK